MARLRLRNAPPPGLLSASRYLAQASAATMGKAHFPALRPCRLHDAPTRLDRPGSLLRPRAKHRAGRGALYRALFTDGSRIVGEEVRDWYDTKAEPKLADRKLLDPKNPVRWVLDTSQSPARRPRSSWSTSEAIASRAA